MNLERQVLRLKEEKEVLLENFNTLFAPDQLDALSKSKSKAKTVRWSRETILKALRMRFALGVRGYTYLLGTGYPLPSYSTLNRKLSKLDFSFGILKEL